MRNKEKWDRHKGKWLTTKQLEGIIEGKIDYFWYEEYLSKPKIADN